MLSVVLYGRNDSHGYNLHKRAAISLNAIAEMLTDPNDEILFVDYNTPDDLPTFPEAIADTLTEKTQARLKVLRVRADVHRERFAARTHLVALEPIARNVAIRRSNPANRWILSTNTDMIFCPRAAQASLSTITAGLKDGFYHLPRFELPEGLWETLDRRDARGIIDAARTWGERFHLNEIVLADHDNLYDGPGDFQLFLREDLFKVGGFHEEMILGWHLDANIARRMRMLRGEVSSALDHLIGYHCDHTRQASAYHKVDRMENDSARFVDQITKPEIDAQMAGWGLAGEDIETFALAEASAARFKKGLEAAVPAPMQGFLQTRYILEDYGRLEYEPAHVLPYLLDLLSCVPPATRLAWVGGRADTLAGFLHGWQVMGGAPALLPDTAPWLGAGEAWVERVPLQAWIDQADVFVFDVSSETSRHHLEFTDQDRARLWAVDQAFKRAVECDRVRRAGGAPARRVLVINGVHNFFESQMMTEVAVTLTPFSSRIRHGYFTDRATSRAAGAGPQRRAAMASLGAAEPPSAREIAAFSALLATAAGAADDDPIWADAARAGAELEVYAAAGLIDADAAAMEVIAKARRLRPSRDPKVQAVVDPAAGAGARSRLARLEDWDDLDWARLARRLFSNRDHADLFEREVWTWERVTLAQNLAAAIPPDPSGLQRPRVLVTGEHPERLAFALANQGYDVDIAEPASLAGGAPKARDWRAEFLGQGWVSPAPVGLADDRADAIAAGFVYDAVILPQNGLFTLGRAAAAEVLKGAVDLLRPGGHLGFATQVQPLPGDERVREQALPHGLTQRGAFGAALQALTGLTLDGSVDARITPRTLDRATNEPGRASLAPPALLTGSLPHFEIPAAWSLRKARDGGDWEGLKAVLEAGVYGQGVDPQSGDGAARVSRLFGPDDLIQAAAIKPAAMAATFDALSPAAGIRKTPIALSVPRSFGPGLVATASLGRRTAGGYELEIEVQTPELAQPEPILAIAVLSDGALVFERLLEVDQPGASRLRTPLEIGQDKAGNVQILFKAQGRVDFDIVNLALR